MLIKVHSKSFPLTRALDDHILSKVRITLSLYTEKIQRVDVFLTDVNGPKGGVDMSCRMKVKADGCPSLVAHVTAEIMYTAINVCSHRLKRVVGRRLDRISQPRKVLIENKRWVA